MVSQHIADMIAERINSSIKYVCKYDLSFESDLRLTELIESDCSFFDACYNEFIDQLFMLVDDIDSDEQLETQIDDVICYRIILAQCDKFIHTQFL